MASDVTPRVNGADAPLVLPVIKMIDKAGVAGNVPDLNEGDQVISINGTAALSNVDAVRMLREAVGEVLLAVRQTPLSHRGAPPSNRYTSGLRPLATAE